MKHEPYSAGACLAHRLREHPVPFCRTRRYSAPCGRSSRAAEGFISPRRAKRRGRWHRPQSKPYRQLNAESSSQNTGMSASDSRNRLPGGRTSGAGNGFAATERMLNMVHGLTAQDTVLFLLSGGGSALMEKPLISGAELQDITSQLLRCGADIVEINAVRKRLSAVKGGRFAQACSPAQVYSIVLSDIIGDPLDMIASGPAYPDSSTCAQAMAVADESRLESCRNGRELCSDRRHRNSLPTSQRRSPAVCGSCALRRRGECAALGYEPVILTDRLTCEAREAGRFLAAVARTHAGDGRATAYLAERRDRGACDRKRTRRAQSGAGAGGRGAARPD